MAGFEFPLGVYPVEEMKPREGFTVAFEQADGSEGGESSPSFGDAPDEDRDQWEAWPDRYVWDIVIRTSRLEALCRALFSMLPGRVYPILDVLGCDAYREIDPYVAYDLVGQERYIEGLRLYRGFLFEDGLVGFGAMSDEPFLYVFVDEHKIVTVRAETALKERVEKVLAAFDLEEVEQIAGADAALHEHRTVLEAPENSPDLLTAEEVVEELKDLWGLSLNIDPERNVSEGGEELGITGWRCLVRAMLDQGEFKYVEVLLTADSLSSAQDLAGEAAEEVLEDLRQEAVEGTSPPADPPKPEEAELDLIAADRVRLEDFSRMVEQAVKRKPSADEETVWAARLVE
jgi:hypothetical protein